MNYKVQMWSILSVLTIEFNLKLTIDTIVLQSYIYSVVFKTFYIGLGEYYKLQNWVEILQGSYTLSM